MKLTKTEKKRRARERKLKSKSYAKKQIRIAGKNILTQWADEVRIVGKCAVCGERVHPLFNKDGTPKMSKPSSKVKLGKKQREPHHIHSVLHAHHLLPKEQYKEFRTKAINGICLCPIHHKFGKFSAHRNPIWFVLWLKRNRREQWEWCVKNLGYDFDA